MSDRIAAVVAFIAAVALFALGMMLGSVASGNGAPTTLVEVSGFVGEVAALAALLYAFAKIGHEPWAQVGRGLAILGIGMLMVGDAASAATARDLGNLVMYVTFIVLAILLWQTHFKLAVLAALTGIVGFFFAAVLEPMGVPPLNLMLIVLWFVAVGIDWLRAPWPVVAADQGLAPAHG
jgi:hypothetical protein